MSDWAAKVLEGVPRYNPGGCGNSVWLHVDDAIAAIVRMGAGDDMVERLLENAREIFLPLLGEAAAHIAALTAQVAEARAAHDADQKAYLAAWGRAEAAEAEAAALRAKVARLEGALVEHNDLLRSALSIAKREGVDGEIASTNWDAYYNRVAVVLKRHHQTANDARAALTDGGKDD